MSDATPGLNVTMNAELAKAIADATSPEVIRAAILEEAKKQSAAATTAAETAAAEKAATDAAAAEVAAKTAAEPQTVSRTENIGGQSFEFTGSSESELDQMILNAYRVAYAVQPTTTQEVVETVPTAEDLAAKAAADAAAKAELELQFKRGDISASDYIERSGAIKAYLESQGVPLEALKTSVEQTQSRTFEQSWASATEEFLASPAGADWPGGARNLETIGLKLQALNLVDAPDKVAALAQAYAAMKATKMIFPNEETETTTTATPEAIAAAAAAKAAADAAAAAAAATATRTAATAVAAPASKTAPTASSVFGASSGVSGVNGAGTTERAIAPQIVIPKDATPQEILELWKAAQLAGGKDLNSAFMDTFSGRRA